MFQATEELIHHLARPLSWRSPEPSESCSGEVGGRGGRSSSAAGPSRSTASEDPTNGFMKIRSVLTTYLWTVLI